MTPKQRRFVDEYLQDFNATQAAIRAGYSEKSARRQGHRMTTNDNIATEIQRRVNELAMGSDERLLELARIARYGRRDGDRLRAIELLGKLAGDYTEKVQTTGEQRYIIEYVNDWRNR